MVQRCSSCVVCLSVSGKFKPLTKRASISMLVPTSTGLLQKPVGVSGGHIIVVVDRANCMDFIYRTEFEGVKILFWQL